MNKSRSTVTTILGLAPLGLGKLTIIFVLKDIKKFNGYIK